MHQPLGTVNRSAQIGQETKFATEPVDGNVARGTAPADAVRAATLHRARPILLTAMAAILGMVPIAPQVFWGPMAFAMIGGLAVATLLTLSLLPAMLRLLLEAEGRKAFVAPDGEGAAT